MVPGGGERVAGACHSLCSRYDVAARYDLRPNAIGVSFFGILLTFFFFIRKLSGSEC